MREYHSFIEHISASDRELLPPWLVRLVTPLEVSHSSRLRVRVTWVEKWWFTLVEGSDPVHVRGNVASTVPDYALLWLALGGQSRPSGTISTLPRPGEMVLLPWDQPAGVISAGEFRYLIAHIPSACLQDGVPQDATSPFGRPISAFMGPGAVLATALRTLADEAGRSESRDALAMMLPDFAQLIVRAFAAQHATTVRHSAPSNLMARVNTYLEAHLADHDLDSVQVARACGLSRRQLFRLYATASASFLTTLRSMRIKKAAGLLILHPEMSVAEVARSSGFRSSAHFCRQFSAIVGKTPTNYRHHEIEISRSCTVLGSGDPLS